MAKVSKNANTGRKTQEGSKDWVKVIVAKKKGHSYKWSDEIIHKDKVQEYLNNLEQNSSENS